MNDFIDPPYEADDVSINKKREFQLVWLLPLCALLVSGWLIYKAVSEKGTVITINFPTAEGLEVDKTKIKYLDVEIGKVTAITIRQDLKTIEVTAQMNKDTDAYLTKNTQFWVVRPHLPLERSKLVVLKLRVKMWMLLSGREKVLQRQRHDL